MILVSATYEEPYYLYKDKSMALISFGREYEIPDDDDLLEEYNRANEAFTAVQAKLEAMCRVEHQKLEQKNTMFIASHSRVIEAILALPESRPSYPEYMAWANGDLDFQQEENNE